MILSPIKNVFLFFCTNVTIATSLKNSLCSPFYSLDWNFFFWVFLIAMPCFWFDNFFEDSFLDKGNTIFRTLDFSGHENLISSTNLMTEQNR